MYVDCVLMTRRHAAIMAEVMEIISRRCYFNIDCQNCLSGSSLDFDKFFHPLMANVSWNFSVTDCVACHCSTW